LGKQKGLPRIELTSNAQAYARERKLPIGEPAGRLFLKSQEGRLKEKKQTKLYLWGKSANDFEWAKKKGKVQLAWSKKGGWRTGRPSWGGRGERKINQ